MSETNEVKTERERPLVHIQGAPITNGDVTIECDSVDFLCNATELTGEGDLCVDVHRTSMLSTCFPKEKRIFATHESPIFMPHFTDPVNIKNLKTHYEAVLTCDVFLLGWPHAKYANLSYLWARPRNDVKGKKFGVSAMFSAKVGTPCYEFRHEILNNAKDVKIPSMILGPTSAKRRNMLDIKWDHKSKDACFDYMFHFAIENICSPGYFTEKIIDCFATCTVPVYIGDPDIGDRWNADGVILLDSKNWREQVNALTEDDYKRRIPAMLENYEKSKRYWTFFNALEEGLKDHGLIGKN